MQYTFGGQVSDNAIQSPSANGYVVKVLPNQTGGTAWSAQTGGSSYACTAIGTDPTPVTTDADGFVRPFLAPDGIQMLWVDFGGIRRLLIGREVGTPTDAALVAAFAPATGSATYETQAHAAATYAPVSGSTNYAPKTRLVSSGTGLSGGGDLSADRTLAVTYGTTSGTAAQGNDSRLSDARTPLTHGSTHALGGTDPLTATAAGAASGSGGSMQITATTTVNATTTALAVPGLSVTVTPAASRRIKVSYHGHVTSTVGGDRAFITILKDGATVDSIFSDVIPASQVALTSGFYVDTNPTSTSHTYSISIQRYSGTGQVNVYGAATAPSKILVEDTGPA